MCLSDATTYRRLRSYQNLIDRAVPLSQAVRDSSSYSKHCSHHRSRCAASDGYHVDFARTFAVAVDNRSAERFLAGCRRWATRSTYQVVLAAAAAVVVAARSVSPGPTLHSQLLAYLLVPLILRELLRLLLLLHLLLLLLLLDLLLRLLLLLLFLLLGYSKLSLF